MGFVLGHDCQMSVDGQTSESVNSAVLRLLSDLDPYGLEPGTGEGAPADEYSPEASAMAAHLIGHGQISGVDIDVIWVRWFGERLSTSNKNRFDRFVADLNALTVSPPQEDPLTDSQTINIDHHQAERRR
jgi:hypothetical protein